LTSPSILIEFEAMAGPCMFRRVILLLLLGLLLTASGCGGSATDAGQMPPKKAGEALPSEDRAPRELLLTDREQEYVHSLGERGGLKVAISNEPSIYEVLADGSVAGIHYHMVLHLAGLLDLPVEFVPVYFNRFFSLNGGFPERVKTDPDYSYTPDLLREVDFYAGALSPLSWREKFLNFIPVFHSRLIFITRRGGEISTPEDLRGKRVALIANTSYQEWFEGLEGVVPANVEYIDSLTGLETMAKVARGEADVTISDANLAIAQIQEFPDLNVTVAGKKVYTLCWAAAKGNEPMISILEKFMALIQSNGVFEAFWFDYYGISTVDYLDLIGFGE
jgi:membrane-bound lytic murein transglycosylase MltF